MPPLPDATVTIQDGALNLAPALNASTQMKFGVATIGYVNTIYSVSDPTSLRKAIGNTGPLAEAGAQLITASGGPLYLVPVNPSTYGTPSATTKFGSGSETLAVAAKPAVQLLAKITTGGAVGTSQVAFSVDSGVTWSTPVATAATVQVPNNLITTIGFVGATGASFVLNDIWTITTAGVATLTGTGTGTVSLSSASPVDTYNCVVSITTGGALGTMQFTYSLDGGINTIGPILSAGSGNYVIADAGIMLTFAGTSTAGDYFTFTTAAASYSSSDLANAWNAVITDPRTFGLAHIVGAAASVGAAATLMAAVETLLDNAAVAYRYIRAFLEVPSDTDANTLAAFAASAATRVAACAGYAYTTGALKPWVLPRNSAWHASARASGVPLKEDLGRVRSGPLKQIPGSLPAAIGIPANAKPLLRDEQVTPGLDGGRFLTLRTIAGRTGFYITNPNLMAPVGSDFKWLQYGRVIDVGAGALRNSALDYLNDSVLTNPDGTIQDVSANAMEKICEAGVRNAFQQGSVSQLYVTVDRTNSVQQTSQVNVALRIRPVGYAKFLALDVGFQSTTLGS